MKKSSLQRDPNRCCVAAYMDLELAAKVKTAIEGETVERKKRAVKSGEYVKKTDSRRPKTIGDALVELADEKFGKINLSRKAQAWKKMQLEKNLAKRKAADANRERK